MTEGEKAFYSFLFFLGAPLILVIIGCVLDALKIGHWHVCRVCRGINDFCFKKHKSRVTPPCSGFCSGMGD